MISFSDFKYLITQDESTTRSISCVGKKRLISKDLLEQAFDLACSWTPPGHEPRQGGVMKPTSPKIKVYSNLKKNAKAKNTRFFPKK